MATGGPMPAPRPPCLGPMQRLLRSADFERVLASPLRCRSTYFAAHHLSATPSRPGKARTADADAQLVPTLSTELSTGQPASQAGAVDDGQWLGLVVPKRHARRAVTRTLVKRQARAALARHAPRLAAGLWVVRLRAPIDRKAFPSAASCTLADLLQADLAELMRRAEARFARVRAA